MVILFHFRPTYKMTGAEIAAIATAVTALIGLGYKIYNGFKKRSADKKELTERELEQKIIEATTDEERAELTKRLYNLRSK